MKIQQGAKLQVVQRVQRNLLICWFFVPTNKCSFFFLERKKIMLNILQKVQVSSPIEKIKHTLNRLAVFGSNILRTSLTSFSTELPTSPDFTTKLFGASLLF